MNIMNIFSRLCICLPAILALCSCVYDYEPEIKELQDERLVIEGDILVGSVSNVKVSLMKSLTSGTRGDYQKVPVTAFVESSTGEKYTGTVVETGNVEIDLTQAQSSAKYRMHVNDTRTGKEYASPWLDVQKAPVIESVSVTADIPAGELSFYLSMHGNGSEYFRWSFDEDWEYRAAYRAVLKYIPPVQRGETGEIVEMPDSENLFYCWGKDHSKAINLATTNGLATNALVNHRFYILGRAERKISYVYCMTLKAQSLSQECYRYWSNLEKVSEMSGDLFAPVPSEMRGNIKCLQDTTESVIGYINASELAEKKTFYYDADHSFYRSDEKYEEPFVVPQNEWLKYYEKAYVPIDYDFEEFNVRYLWGQKSCADCRSMGGTKNKPSWWPTSDI